MKKKIFGGITLLAIAATAAINVSLGSKSTGLSDVSLTKLEALATEWNWPWDWGDGLTKDEKKTVRECTYSNTTSGSANATITSPTGTATVNVTESHTETGQGTKVTCDDGGTENCTPRACG